MSGRVARNDGKYVVLHAHPVKKPCGIHDPVEAITPERIVHVGISVKGKPCKKTVFIKEYRHFLRHVVAVGLYGKGGLYVFCVVFFAKSDKIFVVFEPRKGRLAALKYKIAHSIGIFVCTFYKYFRGIGSHNTAGGGRAVFRLVTVKAVFALHVAK